MGLSSSQGRLLMLTSRLSDIELQEIMISQRQNQLAWKNEDAAKEYNDKMNNYKISIKVDDANEEKGYRKESLSYENMIGAGYLAVGANDTIYLKKDKDDKWIIPKDIDGNDIFSIDSSGKATVAGKEYKIENGTKYLSDPNILQQAMLNGVLFIGNFKDQKENQVGMDITEFASSTEFEYVLDTSDDAQAESKYEYETTKLSKQDNQLEMDLKQLETQHEAVLKEYDSVKEVISNNVERTFNLFSNG